MFEVGSDQTRCKMDGFADDELLTAHASCWEGIKNLLLGLSVRVLCRGTVTCMLLFIVCLYVCCVVSFFVLFCFLVYGSISAENRL